MDDETQQRGKDEEAEAGCDADEEWAKRVDARRRRVQPAARVEERPGRLGGSPAHEQRPEGEQAEQREYGHEVRPVHDDEELAVQHELPHAKGDGPHLGVDGRVLHLGGRA